MGSCMGEHVATVYFAVKPSRLPRFTSTSAILKVLVHAVRKRQSGSRGPRVSDQMIAYISLEKLEKCSLRDKANAETLRGFHAFESQSQPGTV